MSTEVLIAKRIATLRPSLVRWVAGRQELALNSWELGPAAEAAIEPELRARWHSYWVECARQAATIQQASDLQALMAPVPVPDGYYPCPPALAAQAVWPSAPAPARLMVEAGQ